MSTPAVEPSLRAAYARCEEIARSRLENFPVLSEHLPAELVPHFAAVYAYCRASDDAGDESADAAEALAKLDALEGQVNAIFGGAAADLPLEMTALRATVAAKQLPKQPFLDLLSAFRQDQSKTRYESWESLLGYCTRSANPVGQLVLGLLGETRANDSGSARKHALSDAICTGLQLANFWQDVAKDLAKGRIYVPLDAMARHGVDEAQLRDGRCDANFRALMADLSARTRPFFAEGSALADLLEKRHRIPILAFAIAGDSLLDRIERADFDVFRKRPEIGEMPLKTILARAAAARWIPAFRPKARNASGAR